MRNLPAAKISRLFFLGLAFLLLIQPCFSGEIAPMSWTAEENYQLAATLYNQGDYRGALDNCQQAIAKKSGHWRAYQTAGYAYYKLGDTSSSVDYCRKSLDLQPENPALQAFLNQLEASGQTVLDPSKPKKGNPSTPRPKDEYGMLGLTLGSPSFVNLTGGYFFRGFGIRGSVGGSGIQLDLCKVLVGSNDSDFNLNFGLVLGHAEGTLTGTSSGFFGGSYPYSYSFDYDYLGFTLDLHSRGFYLQAGPVIAQGTGYSLGLFGPSLRDYNGTVTYCFQLGYLLRI